MKTLGLTSAVIAVSLIASTQANALDCFGISVPDAYALNLINSQVAGYSYKISDRKTLVINSVQSVSGTECHINAVANVTLKRKLRRDAHGTVSMKGDVYLGNGLKLCIANPRVTDVSLSNTLEIGESIYQWVANKVLPNDLCL